MADSEFDSNDHPDLDVAYKQPSNGCENSPTIKLSDSSDCDEDVISAAANFDYLDGIQLSPSRHTSQTSSSGKPAVIDLNAGFDGSESDENVPKRAVSALICLTRTEINFRHSLYNRSPASDRRTTATRMGHLSNHQSEQRKKPMPKW